MTTKQATTIRCGDGCGIDASPGRRFRPGHDARLASLLLQIANGQLAQSALPKLVRDQLASGALKLPGATLRTAQVTVSIAIAVTPATTDAEVEEAVRKVLGRKAITVKKLVVGKPPVKAVKKPAPAVKS